MMNLKLAALLGVALGFSFQAAGQESEIAKERLYYLENQATIHELYVNGLKPSRDAEAIQKAIVALRQTNEKIQSELSGQASLADSTSACAQYFSIQNQAYDQIIKNLTRLQASKRWGEFRDVGRFWRNKPQEPAPKRLTNDLARAVIQIELLYRVLRPYDSLFLSKQEADAGLFGLGSPVCLKENREALEKAYHERLRNLEIVKLLTLGKRGVWDVRALSNSLVSDAHEEIDQMQLTALKMIGVAVAGYVAFPYIGAAVQAQWPAYASTIHKTFWALNVTLGLYVSAEVGTSLWAALEGEKDGKGSIPSTHAAEEFWPFFETILNLPDSKVALFKMIEQYETELHLNMLQLSPSKSVESWLPQDLKSHGSIEAVIEHYRSL